MINWFKRIFCSQDDIKWVDPCGFPYVGNTVPMPKVKPPKADKNISEPVLSFVECVKKDRKRFILDSNTSFNRNYTSIYRAHSNKAYRVYDKKTKQGWILIGETFSYSGSLGWYYEEEDLYFQTPEFLTRDEELYLIKELTFVVDQWKQRKNSYYKQRHNRRIRDERNRLKEIYCK